MSKTKNDFERAVMASLSFLRRARRTRDGIAETRKSFEALRRRCAPLRLELVVDSPPGTKAVDYDVLLSKGRETTMLGWHLDEGRPWSVDYAEHWAADYVVTVDGRHVSIRDALGFLSESRDRTPRLARELVDQALLANEVDRDPPNVTKKELARSAEVFRIVHGLASEAALKRWMEEAGTHPVAWQEWLAGGIRLSKVKDRISRGRIEPYFRRHRAGLAQVLVVRASAGERSVARDLVAAAEATSLSDALAESSWGGADVVGAIEVIRVDEVGDGVDPVHTTVGALSGPFERDGRHVVAQVLKSRPARLDSETRRLIRERLVSDWLAARHAEASIEWHG